MNFKPTLAHTDEDIRLTGEAAAIAQVPLAGTGWVPGAG